MANSDAPSLRELVRLALVALIMALILLHDVPEHAHGLHVDGLDGAEVLLGSDLIRRLLRLA